jgi:hypothetical protein
MAVLSVTPSPRVVVGGSAGGVMVADSARVSVTIANAGALEATYDIRVSRGGRVGGGRGASLNRESDEL